MDLLFGTTVCFTVDGCWMRCVLVMYEVGAFGVGACSKRHGSAV
jgi:hypothetical protein